MAASAAVSAPASAERRLLVGAILLPAAAYGLLHLGRDLSVFGRDMAIRLGVLLVTAMVLEMVRWKMVGWL